MTLDNATNTATADHTTEHDHPEHDHPEQNRTEALNPDVSRTPEKTGGFAAGAAAVVSAGLGLSSLTGTGLGEMMRARQEIVGQIEASVGGGGADQIDAFYGAPWHTSALVNGTVALVAVLIGGVLLAAHSRRPDTAQWVKAVALGGVVLGGLGVLVAGGMYLDIFAAQPTLPATPALGGG